MNCRIPTQPRPTGPEYRVDIYLGTDPTNVVDSVIIEGPATTVEAKREVLADFRADLARQGCPIDVNHYHARVRRLPTTK